MKRLASVGWIVATLVSVWISTQAVAAVRDEVTQPRVPIAAGVPEVAETVTGAPAEVATTEAATSPSANTTAVSTTSSASPTTSTMFPTTSTTTPPASTAPPSSTTAPTTTAPPTTTTTSAPTPTTTPPQVQTHQLVGGWVRIVVGDGTVNLDAAAPAVGFTMEISTDGPGKVEVRFHSDEHESRFKADWEAGRLRIDIDEKD